MRAPLSSAGSASVRRPAEICNATFGVGRNHTRPESESSGEAGVWATTAAWGRKHQKRIKLLMRSSWKRISRSPTGIPGLGVSKSSRRRHTDLDLHDVNGAEAFTVAKLQGGYTRYLAAWKGLKPGFGLSASAGFVPRSLETVYGSRVNPGLSVFFTVRPVVMRMATPASGTPHVH